MTVIADARTDNDPPQPNRSRSPWLSIWFRPGEAIDRVTSARAWVSVVLLAGFYAVAFLGRLAIDNGWLMASADWRTVAAIVLGGFVFGLVNLFVAAFLLRLSGLALGGHASQAHLRAALAWGSVPATVTFAIKVAAAVGLKLAGIAPSQSAGGAVYAAIAAFIAVLVVVLVLWTLVITVATVSRVQRFGAIRAFANVVIGCVMGSAVLAIIIRTFVFQPFNIPSASMTPTLLVGDYFVVSKFAYGYSRFSLPFSPPLFAGRIFAAEPQRGDIAIFRFPRNPAIDFVKRIVGLPGDRIRMEGGVLIINDVPVHRERVEDFSDDETGKAIRCWRITLPNGVSYTTLDLIDNGFYDNTPVYTVPPGHYFMLGDNLDNSVDSRVPQEQGGGYVPFENLVGRAAFIFFSIHRADGKPPVIRSERMGRTIQ